MPDAASTPRPDTFRHNKLGDTNICPLTRAVNEPSRSFKVPEKGSDFTIKNLLRHYAM